MITSLIMLGLVSTPARRIVSIEPIPAPANEKAKEVWAGAISNAGFVIGGYRDILINSDTLPQLWSETLGSVKVDYPQTAKSACLHGVNSKGEAVGEYYDGTNYHAFTWSTKGGFKELAEAGPYGRGWAINDRGDVAAISRPQSQWPERSVLLRDGKRIELKPVEGYLHTSVQAINANGQTAGLTYGTNVEKPSVATVWDTQGNPTAIPLLSGAARQLATAINDHGDVVGEATMPNDTAQMFLYSGGKISRLPDGGGPSMAHAINNKGQIVGTTQPAKYGMYAFLIEDGKLTNLNDLLPENSGWYLERATGINDNGEISGDGYLKSSIGNGKFKTRRQAWVLKLN